MFPYIFLYVLLSSFLPFLICFEPNNQINLPISEIFPSVLNVTKSGIFECFDETINGIQIPLFEQNITGINIVAKYYVSFINKLKIYLQIT